LPSADALALYCFFSELSAVARLKDASNAGISELFSEMERVSLNPDAGSFVDVFHRAFSY
jgi:hypothetical protein